LPFALRGAARKSGDVAIVPPRTTDARIAPGRSARSPILRWSRRDGIKSQKAVDAISQAGRTTIHPRARRLVAETSATAIAALTRKKKSANRP